MYSEKRTLFYLAIDEFHLGRFDAQTNTPQRDQNTQEEVRSLHSNNGCWPKRERKEENEATQTNRFKITEKSAKQEVSIPSLTD